MGWDREGPGGQRACPKAQRVVGGEPFHLRWTSSVQHDGHGLFAVGHVVSKHVGHGKTRAVRSLPQSDGFETKLSEL